MLVAGSLPPLEGSYNTKGTMTEEEIEAGYEVVIENLKDHVDFFIAETLGSIKEAIGAGRALRRFAPSKKFFISWSTLDSGTIRNGESVSDAVRTVEADDRIGAFGYMLNCGPPENYREMLT